MSRSRRATPSLWPAALLLLCLLLPGGAHAAGQTAFVDGGSVAVAPSGITTLATLPTTFSAGNNFVIAAVEFETTVDTNLTFATVWLKQAGSGASLMANFYDLRLTTGIMAKRKSYALMGIDTGAGASPSYVVQVSYCCSVGVTGEAKILAVAGVTGSQIQNPLDADINATETTLTTLSTSLPAGDNIVLAIVETAGTGNSTDFLSYVRLKNGTTTLAQSEYPLYHAAATFAEYSHVQLIPYLDVGQAANPSYSVTAAEGAGGSKIKGLAKIVAFSRGALSAAYSDGPSTSVGTSETTVNALDATFAAGSEVAVIASQQFASGVFATRIIPSGLLKLQQNNDAGAETSNQYELNIREGGATPAGGHGRGFALLNRRTSTPANPQYEVKATSSDVNLNVEAKVLALAAAGSTEAELSSFAARGEDSAVALEWETASELHNLGFHLYRATSEAGPYARITSSLIPGLGSSPIGARYSYTDTGLTNGVRYYYQLEDLETTGRTERHGPVSAIPVAWATPIDPGDDPGTDPGGGGGESTPVESTRVSYGDPSAVSLNVLRRDATGVDLELVTGGFYATPEADGSMSLEIPGFELQGQPGTPAIPVERTFLEAVAGRQVRITSVVPSDVLPFPWSRPALAQAPQLIVGRDGTVQAGHRRVRPAWMSRRPYPADSARIVTTAFQGETKKALLELAPLRWNSSSGQLLLARRLRVRVAFDGIVPGETPLGGSRGRALPRHGARGSRSALGLVAHLLVHDKGLYAVTFEDAFRYRLRGVPTSRLCLSRLGQSVPFHVEPDPSRFSPGSVLYFLSEGGLLSTYTNEAVYELAVGTGGTPMPIVSSPPAGATLTEAVEHRSWETNQYYMSGLLEAPDLWLWDSIISGLPTKTFPFTLSGLAVSSDAAVLSVWLQGASDLDGSPDHHIRLSVNDSFVAETSWDGNSPRRLEAPLYPGLLHDGENHLDIDNVGDTPAVASLVYLDRFSVDYPRTLTAEAGRFEAVFGPPGSATLAGLGAGSLVLDTTNPEPRWVAGSAAGPSGLSFGTEAGHRHLAVSPEAILRPAIRWPSLAGGDLRGTDNQADYLLLAPRELLPAAAPLLQLRQEQGLHSRAVPLEEIYDVFGYGEKSPQAIRDFIAYAYHHWTPPSPRYVLLLGDATYDPKDFTHTGVKDHLPAFMFKSTWLWTASDPAYASVNGEDGLPDLAVGRLPASSLEQAERLVQKLVAFERSGFDPSAPAVLVADNPDRAGDFEADTDDIASGPLAGHPTEKIYLGRLGTEATRSAILAAFDRGASLVSYVGHGAPAIWASERLLHSSDMAKLSPRERPPLVFTMNCLNGYFLPMAFDSLAEALVKAEDRGAIAAFSPSGLSLDAAAHVYHKALVTQVASGPHARLGDAILAAQSDYAASGVFPELLRVYNLFGDPATRLR